jgi:hypothetical protein
VTDAIELELREHADAGVEGAADVLGDYLEDRGRPRAPRRKRVELDQCIITIGPPKCGKTTIQRELVKAHLVKYADGIALVHDVNHQFRDLCRMYATVPQWRAAREKAALAKQPFPRGAAFTDFGEASAVAALAMELGSTHNSATDVQLPIYLGYDESAMMEDSGSTFIGSLDLQVAVMRRHRGIAPAYNTQRQSALMQAFFDAATDVYVFRQSSDDAIRAIEKKLGQNKGSLQQLASFDNFRYVH